MSLRTSRKGAKAEATSFIVAPSSLGHILIAATGKGICAVLIGDDRQALIADLKARFPQADLIADDAALKSKAARIAALVETPDAAFDMPLDIRGTIFQQRVWKELLAIAPGETATYADLAKAIGQPSAARAVAAACAANPLAIVVPCHRVVSSNGALSGYRWGIERKKALLDRERTIPHKAKSKRVASAR